MVLERTSRSNTYQHLLREISCSDEFLGRFNNTDSINNHLNPFKYDETVLKLKDDLINRVLEVIDTECTPIQREILTYFFKDGYTQLEIAKIRKCNQSSVTKSMFGNDDGIRETKYGGSIPKLRNILSTDLIYLELKAKIEEYQQENE